MADAQASELDLFRCAFGEHAPRVQTALEHHRSVWQDLGPERQRVSDVVDGERDASGNEIQYVDLVMEGGGVLGLAMVGFTYALESVGIRFLRIAGTSAGAVNAIAVAALAKPGTPSGPTVLRELAELPLLRFVDGGPLTRRLIRFATGAGIPNGRSIATMAGAAGIALLAGVVVARLAWAIPITAGLAMALLLVSAILACAAACIAAGVLWPLVRRKGLNPGRVFLDEMKELLARHGIRTLRDLRARMRPSRPLRVRPERLEEDLKEGRKPSENPVPVEVSATRLALVAADLTTESKVVFPKMAELYYASPDEVNPACFVRASMSVPGFFEPVTIENVPQHRPAWKQHTGYEGRVPEPAVLVDGGLMSNFPINLFHSTSVPRCPTFGVKLGVDRAEPRELKKLSSLVTSLFDAARHTADYDFLYDHPDYSQVVSFIPTRSFSWLDFALDAKAKADLFCRGVESATRFLGGFDWEKYKRTRQQQLTLRPGQAL